MTMKCALGAAAIGIAIICATAPLAAQMRGSGSGPRPSRPADDQRFKSAARIVHPPLAGGRRARPVRSLWFGLISFDRSWLWTPGAADDVVLAPSLPPQVEAPIGGLQLDVEPRRALVYVDGWYVGAVHEFSGYYRHLDLDAGWHTIEMLAADYDPLIVDVTVAPNRTTTYRASLNRR